MTLQGRFIYACIYLWVIADIRDNWGTLYKNNPCGKATEDAGVSRICGALCRMQEQGDMCVCETNKN